MTLLIDSRSQHEMYEDRKPLFANLVLPLLAIALADNASQDYLIFEGIEAVPSFAVERLKNMQCYWIKYSFRNSVVSDSTRSPAWGHAKRFC